MTASAQDPLIGRLLDGRYRLDEVIAYGGMATVYLAHDERLDRRVAVKVMKPEFATDAEFVKKFTAEAQTAGRLSHPDIVAVFDHGRDESAVFLVMEYVEGRTLRDVLAARGRLRPAEAAQVMEHVLSALGAAHRAGIVHRDVKPENVLMADDGRVKVADFGLARAISQAASTRTMGAMIGTVSYLAPEQVERGTGDARSDVYSAGILLFELLTGEKPFVGDSPMSVVYQHVHNTVPAPSERVPDLPESADRLVAAATDRDPMARPADAVAFLGLLHRSGLGDRNDPARVEHTLIVPREPSPAPQPQPAPAEQRSRRPAPAARARAGRRRRGWIPWAAALVLLLLAAGLGGVAWYQGIGPGARVSVPSLIKLSQVQATAKAEQAQVKVRFEESVFSEVAPSGTVIRTNPLPGVEVRKNSTVAAVLSKGPERLDVPPLAGTEAAAAEQTLSDAGLTMGKTTESFSEDVAVGQIISADPEPGTPQKRGTPVSVVVSKGPAPVPVPSIIGLSAKDAEKALQKAEMKGTASEAFSDTVSKGKVVSQKPIKGELVQKGTTISYVVSKGPELFEVPDVTGKKEAEARRILTAAGFKVSVTKPFIREFYGVRIQRPTGLQPKGTTISLTVV